MGKSRKQSVGNGGDGFDSLTATELRVLHLLQITRRPLLSHEVESALGIPASAGQSAREGLAERGFISSRQQKSESGSAADAKIVWSLAEKSVRP